jgi:tRNA (guanine-N7-)-methyltransferase
VRRSRRLPLEELAPYLLEPAQPPVPLDWPAVFGNTNPVELEVGFGKGLFLLNAAESRPGVNFLGIEIVRKYQLFAATRFAVRGLRNVRLALGDARLFLRDGVPAMSLQAIHVYFPDPWWKTRHHKRRVFTPEFALLCERTLRPGGRLHIATDVGDYFQVMTELLAQNTQFVPVPPPEAGTPAHDLDYLTNFERKFRKQGKPIYRALYEREESSPGQGVASEGLSGPVAPAG